MSWEPNYDLPSQNPDPRPKQDPTQRAAYWQPSAKPPITRPAITSEDDELVRISKYKRIPSPGLTELPSPSKINWLNWAQRIIIAILICVVAWMVYRSEFASTVDDDGRPSTTIQLDWQSMDQAANAARAKVYSETAAKASEFKDLQSLIKWQDEQLRTARLAAYQPWIEVLSEQLDEDRYDPQRASKIFQQAADESNY